MQKKIEIDESNDLEYFHVPADNGVREASDYLYDFTNVRVTLIIWRLFNNKVK